MPIHKFKKVRLIKDLDLYLNAHGWISYFQLYLLGLPHKIHHKAIISKFFRQINNAIEYSFWNFGEIKKINDLNICPIGTVTRIKRIVPKTYKIPNYKLVICTYKTNNINDLNMLRILRNRSYVLTKNFPPLDNEYMIIKEGSTFHLLWAEQEQSERKEHIL